MDFVGLSDGRILETIGERVRTERLNQNRTQLDVAKHSGVGLNVIKRLENGRGCTLSSLVRILRALGKLDHLDMFLPEPGISPIALARMSGRQRKEATGKRGRPSTAAAR
ncbi:MAG TPA: helix-turn-helix transcriptional regulator [Bacteroidota bacterium]|nr:helix-turn-helix transcriptional regulator [Bacteroidota bacterium]